jgi:hypothetical protein
LITAKLQFAPPNSNCNFHTDERCFRFAQCFDSHTARFLVQSAILARGENVFIYWQSNIVKPTLNIFTYYRSP